MALYERSLNQGSEVIGTEHFFVAKIFWKDQCLIFPDITLKSKHTYFIHTFVHPPIHTCIHPCILHTSTCIDVCIYLYMSMYACIHTYVIRLYIHAYTHNTHTHTHINTCFFFNLDLYIKSKVIVIAKEETNCVCIARRLILLKIRENVLFDDFSFFLHSLRDHFQTLTAGAI